VESGKWNFAFESIPTWNLFLNTNSTKNDLPNFVKFMVHSKKAKAPVNYRGF